MKIECSSGPVVSAKLRLGMEETPGVAPITQEAKKFDSGKLPWHLVPMDAVECIATVLEMGAKKYGKNNWRNGMDWSRVYDAMLRHTLAFQNGEKFDQESGLPHTWHAATNALFLVWYEMNKVGNDDRYRHEVG